MFFACDMKQNVTHYIATIYESNLNLPDSVVFPWFKDLQSFSTSAGIVLSSILEEQDDYF